MSDYLRISVRFLDGAFHGRGDSGEPEWPPSPLRLFQALVAAAAARWNERDHLNHAVTALQWLEVQAAPLIIAPRANFGTKYRLYIPDNTGDEMARKWTNGNEAAIIKRTEKDVRSTRLQGGDAVHYLWLLSESDLDFPQVEAILLTATRSITHLGWGIDMVAADASVISAEEAEKLSGQCWQPSDDDSGTSLRVPRTGTLENLIRKHAAFLGRASADTFRPVPPLSAFAIQTYRSSTMPPRIPFAAFSLLAPNVEGYRSFDPVHQGKCVAGMLRHLASDKSIMHALGWPLEKVNRLVLGHAEPEGQPHVPVDGPRLAFLPLPSLEYRGGKGTVVGSIRRVLVTGLRGFSQTEVNQIAQLLSGGSLVDEDTKKAVAILSRLPNSEKMVRQYTEKATTWATVTPVVLPGYDDPRKYRRRLFAKADQGESQLNSEEQAQLLGKLDARNDLLLRKAIRQAGYSEELAQNAKLDWRGSGFWPGTDLASRYAVPEKLRRFRRLHVRITWTDVRGNLLAVPGPLCLGGGRFIGLGLFAPMPPV
jgi:CRISPR-associated protein Csb2